MNRNMRAWFAPLDRMPPLYPCDAGLASAAACTKAAQKLVQISAGGVPSARMRGRRMVPKLNKTSAGIFVVLTMFLALMGPTPGAAAAGLDKKSSADAKKATQLYKQGSYEEAAAVFLQLSIDNPGMPVFVRNLGACYYYLRRPDPALSNLREYLVKKKDVTPEDRAEVEGWIAEMDQLRQHGSAPAAAALPVAPMPPAYAPAPPAAPVVMPETPPAAPPQAPFAPAPSYNAPQPQYASPQPQYASPQPQYSSPQPQYSSPQQQYSSPQPQYSSPQPQYSSPATAPPPALGSNVATAQVPPPVESGSGVKTAGWVVGGVGVAGLVFGGVFSYLASSNYSDIEKKYDPGKKSDGDNYAIAQWVCYGVGAAAIVTAVILLATGKDTSPKSVVLAPTVGPGIAGAALTGSF
jgi:hypothetical protein